MTVYDLATDISASTIAHAWIWEEGGEFFGVPVSNFLGWWFCTVTFYLVFAGVLHKRPDFVRVGENRTSVLQFILIYISLGLTVILDTIFGTFGRGAVADVTGKSWNIADIQGSSILWVVFGMFVLALFAIVNLYRIGLPGQGDDKKLEGKGV